MAKPQRLPEEVEQLTIDWQSLVRDIKDREEEFEASVKEDKLLRDILETELLAALRDHRREGGIVPDMGTLYMTTRTSAKVEDAKAFFDHVFSTGESELLEARCGAKAAEAYVEEHHEPPPGVNVSTMQKLGFRRKQ